MRRTISAETELLQKADVRWRKLKYKKFSHYVQALIEGDVTGCNPHALHLPPESSEAKESQEQGFATDPPVTYRVAPKNSSTIKP